MITALDPSSPLRLHDPFRAAEIERILNLQIVPALTPEEIEWFNRSHVQAQAYADGFRLNEAQCDAVSTYEIHNSLLGKIQVGGGKTLIALMCAAHAMAKGLAKMILFIPPEVLNQLVATDIGWARSRVHINFPIHVLGGRNKVDRLALARSGRKGLYIMPYSYLSTADTNELLAHIAPELIIADEAHRLANYSAARTRRFLTLLKDLETKHKPPELVLLSGTITGKSIKDYAHLIKWCLRDRSPLPTTESMVSDWAQLIDAEAGQDTGYAQPPASSALGYDSMVPLIKWAKKNFVGANDPENPLTYDVTGFRKAFQYRLNSAPGVVSKAAEVGTSLYLKNIPAEQPAGPEGKELLRLVDRVVNDMVTPNGDEIQYAIHQWKWLNELSCGFYNELTWPTAEALADRRNKAAAHKPGVAMITVPDATELLLRARIHHQAGQAYNSLLRKFLTEQEHIPGVDTPMLVGQDMFRNGERNVPHEMYEAWKDWKDLEFEGMPERDSRGVRVCDFKIKAAVDWAVSTLGGGDGGIIFYFHQEVGRWLVEALNASGLFGDRVVHAPAGDVANRLLADQGNRNKVVVASAEAHGTGKNLQYFHNMYVMQWVRSAKETEQLIGRLHRQGQEADELVVATGITLPFEERNLAATLNDSLYIHQSTGDRQKLIYATWDPLPKIYPAAVLIEAGLEASKLTAKMEKAFLEKFGSYARSP